MPPQPGMFALPYASTHKARASNNADIHPADMNMGYHHSSLSSTHHSSSMIAGPSSRIHGEERKAKERDSRPDGEGIERQATLTRPPSTRHYAESISSLHSMSLQLAARPDSQPAYTVRLYPLSIERAALLAQLAVEEKNSIESINAAYELERERVEEEWKRGRDRIRERLLEGIEERRRKAREEKDGEGTVDASLDSQSRPHITRKLRNKLGTSPPPTPLSGHLNNAGTTSNGPIISGPITNPHSLSVDELPSPFPLPLTAASLPNTSNGAGGGNGRRRAKGGGFQVQAVGGLGKSFSGLTTCKESEIESDLGDIRRGNKRRRVAAGAMAGKA
ncbi:hypothetical protein DENSPDRAFT_772455 [Dentipellis sp. KUC8613]|nr:hypothetical protein DENSPDRAFT_772455 [Dentipellis sp. KUC8613]